MKKVDLNFKVFNADGSTLPKKAGQNLAVFLERSVLKEESKIVKYFNWSRILCTSGILELDEGDIIELTTFIKEHEGMFTLLKRPLLEAFSKPPI